MCRASWSPSGRNPAVRQARLARSRTVEGSKGRSSPRPKRAPRRRRVWPAMLEQVIAQRGRDRQRSAGPSGSWVLPRPRTDPSCASRGSRQQQDRRRTTRARVARRGEDRHRRRSPTCPGHRLVAPRAARWPPHGRRSDRAYPARREARGRLLDWPPPRRGRAHGGRSHAAARMRSGSGTGLRRSRAAGRRTLGGRHAAHHRVASLRARGRSAAEGRACMRGPRKVCTDRPSGCGPTPPACRRAENRCGPLMGAGTRSAPLRAASRASSRRPLMAARSFDQPLRTTLPSRGLQTAARVRRAAGASCGVRCPARPRMARLNALHAPPAALTIALHQDPSPGARPGAFKITAAAGPLSVNPRRDLTPKRREDRAAGHGVVAGGRLRFSLTQRSSSETGYKRGRVS